MVLALFLQSPPAEEAQKIIFAMMAIFPLLFIIFQAIVIIPFWFICKKAGFSPWLSLLNLIPLGGVILWYVLAFSDWKVVPVTQAGWAPPQPPPYPPQPPRV